MDYGQNWAKKGHNIYFTLFCMKFVNIYFHEGTHVIQIRFKGIITPNIRMKKVWSLFLTMAWLLVTDELVSSSKSADLLKMRHKTVSKVLWKTKNILWTEDLLAKTPCCWERDQSSRKRLIWADRRSLITLYNCGEEKSITTAEDQPRTEIWDDHEHHHHQANRNILMRFSYHTIRLQERNIK